MKKVVLSFVSLLMVFSVSTANVFALEDDTELSKEIIEITDDFVIEEHSQLVISDEDELKKEIGALNFETVKANLEFSNQLIEDGIIGVKENGSLYILGDDSLTIQGGNLNATRLYWWGWHRYNSNTNTKKIVKDFKKQASYSNSWAAVLIFGSLSGVPGGFVLSAIPTLVGGSLSSFAKALENKNNGYGTIIAANWVVIGSNIKSQSKNTK